MMASHDIAMNLDVKVPMRDGVRLPADLYLPRGAPHAPAATSSVSIGNFAPAHQTVYHDPRHRSHLRCR